MNDIARNLTFQNYLNFSRSFENSKAIYWDYENNKFRHSAEFGSHREELIKSWLRIVVPENYGISSGFVIGPKGSVSTQCDIIIYDRARTPTIENPAHQKFFPIETVCCIGEVKSDISSTQQLNKYLLKLSEIKKIRDEVTLPEPYYRGPWVMRYSKEVPFDNVFSILICKKLTFNIENKQLEYGSLPHYLWHNMILSLDDGLILYHDAKNNTQVTYAKSGQHIHSPFFLKKDRDDDLPVHIESFLSNLQQGINKTTL